MAKKKSKNNSQLFNLVAAFDPAQIVDRPVRHAVGMHRADGKIKRRRIVQEAVHRLEGKGALAQFRAHAQLDAVADRFPRLAELLAHILPVVAVERQRRLVPLHPRQRLDMVGEADLVRARRHGGLGHLAHGVAPVGRNGGVAVIVGDIVPVSHSLNFEKKLLRSS